MNRRSLDGGSASLRLEAWLTARVAGLIISSLVLGSVAAVAQSADKSVRVPVRSTLQRLLSDEDTDGDFKITIDDPRVSGTDRGDRRFTILSVDHRRYEVTGTYFLSNLLQELHLLEEAGVDTARVRFDHIFEQPAERISRSIRELYWHGLTRSVDEAGLPRILHDDKTRTADGKHYIYIAQTDTTALGYFRAVSGRHPGWNLAVVQLPPRITAEYVRSLDGRHGILPLGLKRGSDGSLHGVPFVVPGGRFNEMYGWDSYFIALGLLRDHQVTLAKAMVDNLAYEIDHYGKILNANRTYYLTRSQPPFLTSMALAVYADLPKDGTSKLWLARVMEAAIREYRQVWMNRDHVTECGLSRYKDTGFGPAPEVEPGHYDAIYRFYSAQFHLDVKTFEKEYLSGRLSVPQLDTFFVHDRAMRESGHDTSYRLEGRCADLVTVDLNSLLYKIERDISETIEREFGGALKTSGGTIERSSTWKELAEHRRRLVNRYLWNPDKGMYFDFGFVHGRSINYVSATTLYPLWAGLATKDQAAILVRTALPLLEMPGGVAGSTEESRGPITPEHPLRQWDYPFGWAPHQMLVWQGLRNYGMDEIARRLAYRWIFTITLNAAFYNGTVPEKFDVVRRTHEVFAEYGNVGTKFAYLTREGFGWTNASYQVGLSLLTGDLKSRLDRLIPPEWIFQEEER